MYFRAWPSKNYVWPTDTIANHVVAIFVLGKVSPSWVADHRHYSYECI